jgi:hypothetical protein
MSAFDLDGQVRDFIRRTESFDRGLGPDAPLSPARITA